MEPDESFNKVHGLIVKRDFDRATRHLLQLDANDPGFLPCANELLSSLCNYGRLNQAITLKSKCPPHVQQLLNYTKVIVSLMGQGRFEKAAQAVTGFELDRNPVFVSQFIQLLVSKTQFKLAIRWTEKLSKMDKSNVPAELCAQIDAWNPKHLIEIMVNAQFYEDALKYTHEYNLASVFPPSTMINLLIDQCKISFALQYIKLYKLEDVFPVSNIIDKMILKKQWGQVDYLINSKPVLRDIYTPTMVLSKMMQAHDWVSVLKFIPRFGFHMEDAMSLDNVPREHHDMIYSIVDGMLADGEMFKVMNVVTNFGLFDRYPGKTLIDKMIQLNQFHLALMYMKMFNLAHEYDPETFSRINDERCNMLIAHRKLMAKRARQLEQDLAACPAHALDKDIVRELGSEEVARLSWFTNRSKIPIATVQDDFMKEKQKPEAPGFGDHDAAESSDEDSDDEGEEIIMVSNTRTTTATRPPANARPHPPGASPNRVPQAGPPQMYPHYQPFQFNGPPPGTPPRAPPMEGYTPNNSPFARPRPPNFQANLAPPPRGMMSPMPGPPGQAPLHPHYFPPPPPMPVNGAAMPRGPYPPNVFVRPGVPGYGNVPMQQPPVNQPHTEPKQTYPTNQDAKQGGSSADKASQQQPTKLPPAKKSGPSAPMMPSQVLLRKKKKPPTKQK